VNFCTSDPCINNGVCAPLINAYQCRCANGFQGINCQKDIVQPCLSSPCL
jgi:Notch-like protein